MAVTAERRGQETMEAERAKKAKEAKVKSRVKAKASWTVSKSSNWQEGWLEAGTSQSHREQKDEHADGWWKTTDEQTGSGSGWWMTANDQTAWRVGGFEINSAEPKYNKHDRWGGQEWLMLNCDSGAAVTALRVEVSGGLLLEKRGEFRVASGAVIPNLGKIKM